MRYSRNHWAGAARNAAIAARKADGWTFKALAEEYGLSTSRIREIVARAERDQKRLLTATGGLLAFIENHPKRDEFFTRYYSCET